MLGVAGLAWGLLGDFQCYECLGMEEHRVTCEANLPAMTFCGVRLEYVLGGAVLGIAAGLVLLVRRPRHEGPKRP